MASVGYLIRKDIEFHWELVSVQLVWKVIQNKH
jgi:hypothetical protein